MANYPECPVDFIKADEIRARITALFVVIITSLFIVTARWVIPCFLVIDFAIRSFQYQKASPLARISKWIASVLQLPSKPTDRGPKIFAARIGLILSVTLLISSVLAYTDLSRWIGGVLLFFAFLESFWGFCAACYIYPYWKVIFSKVK